MDASVRLSSRASRAVRHVTAERPRRGAHAVLFQRFDAGSPDLPFAPHRGGSRRRRIVAASVTNAVVEPLIIVSHGPGHAVDEWPTAPIPGAARHVHDLQRDL